MMLSLDELIEDERFRRVFVPLASLILIVVFVSLGLWQLDRAAEKNEVRAYFESDAPFAVITGETTVSEFQRIEASGRYIDERQVLIDNVILDGRRGYYALTAFRYAANRPLLVVNRGFIPRAPGNAEKPDLEVATDRRRIRGRAGFLPRVGVRAGDAFLAGDDWPKLATYPTIDELSREFGAELLPFVLLLGAEDADGFVRRWEPRDSGPTMHYGYAFQWFAMAAAVAGIYAWRARSKRT